MLLKLRRVAAAAAAAVAVAVVVVVVVVALFSLLRFVWVLFFSFLLFLPGLAFLVFFCYFFLEVRGCRPPWGQSPPARRPGRFEIPRTARARARTSPELKSVKLDETR